MKIEFAKIEEKALPEFLGGGSCPVIYDGSPIRIEAGDFHYCPKGHSHTLINDGFEDLYFHAVVPQQ